MKRFLSLAVILIAAVSTAFAQTVAKASSDEEALIQIENNWMAALQKNDVAAFESIVSPEWMITDPTGMLVTKSQVVEDMKAGNMKIESYKIDELKVKIFGDTAIVYGLETEKSTYKGNDVSGQYRYTDVFVIQGGKWKAVATHVNKVEKH